ncbi:MAG: ABC transporter ATP-binding protein [Anaerolineaceae bacterium]|nr:ABC transporter ATP-binding protein [Anaerolineaceae bacterium]
MAHLELEHIDKQFGRTQALQNLSLEVQDQEFMVLLGPTGAGKTTTLRCVAGLEKLNGGTVKMNGRTINNISPTERNVAFVFQNYALYPRKTVYQNIAFPLQARQLSKADIDRRINDVTKMLRINHLHDRLPAQLSGGEQQRVALSRALVRQPNIFLMDEPLTNLDFKLRAQMRGELKRIQQDLKATFFYVTNDQVEALSMGNRVAVLKEGVLQQVGPPQEVYEQPVNLFVAGFIGSVRMNFLDCVYDSNGRFLKAPDQAWQVVMKNGRHEAILANGNNDRLILGVRPEDIQFSPAAIGADSAAIAGEIYVAEPLGDRIIYDVSVGTSIVKVKTPPTVRFQPGELVQLNINLERSHIFDRVQEHVIRKTHV